MARTDATTTTQDGCWLTKSRTLKQVGSFNTSPDIGFTSIWQTGNGLAADEFGNIYAVTAEDASKNEANDVAYGGSSYSNSVIELTPNPTLANTLVLTQWFAPDDVLFLNTVTIWTLAPADR